MSVIEVRILKLTELQKMPETVENAKAFCTPFFLCSNTSIEWTVKPVDKVPQDGCSDPTEFNRKWYHWRIEEMRRPGGTRLAERGARYGYTVNENDYRLPPSTLIISLHQLRRNARRVLDPMLLTRDWDTPTRCFITHKLKPLAVITAGVKI